MSRHFPSKLLWSLFVVFLWSSLSSAHFLVQTPTPLGDNINNEDVSPCGGFSPSPTNNVTDFHVGGDAIGLTTLHAQSYFAYRGQVGTSLSPANWTVLIPTVEEYGLNGFCEPSVAVPASWTGQQGLLQIIQDAEDGVHYQVSRALQEFMKDQNAKHVVLSSFILMTYLSQPC
jgi:hypothetical protein